MEDVQKYDSTQKTLLFPVSAKAKKFLEHNCIEKVSENSFLCKPILGYNVTTYSINRPHAMAEFYCNCQGFRKRHTCSHIQAVRLYMAKYGPRQATLF